MNEIDFERIRMDAVNAFTGQLTDSSGDKLMKTFAKAASGVTKQMLEDYHRQLFEALRSERQQ